MAANPDGTATCDRCSSPIPGYGALYGLITNDLDPAGATRQLLLCYYHDCRSIALQDMVLLPLPMNDQSACAVCQVPVRGIGDAMLCTDLNYDDTARVFALCYVNGHRDQLLTQAHGWAPPLIRITVLATTWWNMPAVTQLVTGWVSTNWDVFANAGVVTVTAERGTAWNDQALTTVTVRDVNRASNPGGITSLDRLVVLPKPAGSVTGDLLVATFTTSVVGAVTAPDGWTLAEDAVQQGASVYAYWHWYSAGDAGVASWTWKLNSESAWGGHMVALGSVDPVTPFDTLATDATYTGTGTTNFTADPVTTSTDNTLLLSTFGANTGSSLTVTVPAGWQNDTTVNAGFTANKGNALAHLNDVPIGTYAPVWRLSSGRAGGVVLMAVRSAAGAVLFNVVASRAATWNVSSGLTGVSAARTTTWTARQATTATRLSTWTTIARVSDIRATTWGVLSGASGIVARTAVNQNGPASGSENSTVTLPKPSDAVTGDVLVASFSLGATVTVTAPTGWTLLESSKQSGINVYLYWHRLAAGETATSWDWALSTATTWGGNMQAFGGVHATTPIDVTPVAATFTTSTTASYPVTITTATNGAMLVTTLGANTGGASLTPTVPTGFTNDVTANTGFASGKANAYAHALKTTAGSGTYTWTISSGRAGGVVIAALRPA